MQKPYKLESHRPLNTHTKKHLTKSVMSSNIQNEVISLVANCIGAMNCVVPENIHTPNTEGIRNYKGEGG